MFYKQDKNDILLFVKVTPNASYTKFGKEYNNMLKIFIDAAPEDNKANKKLIRFLSKELRIPKSSIIIEQGEKSKEKILRLVNSIHIKNKLINLPSVPVSP